MNLCVLIPAYNEARAIGDLIDRLRGLLSPSDTCVVIDDCSTDETAEIVRKRGVRLLGHAQRRGKGSALRTGLAFFLEHDYEACVLMDGDGQHDPLDVPRFKQKAAAEDLDVVIGDRMQRPEGMPVLRRLTNRFLSLLISLRAGVRIPDSQCGFRLLKRKVVEKLDFSSSKFEIESEMILRAARAGFRIGTVPIRSIYGWEESKIRPLRDGIRFFRFYFKDLLSR